MCLGGVYYRERKPSLWKEDAHSFYIVKGMIEDLFGDLHINGYAFSPSSEPFLHPGQSCEIRISGSGIGLLGAVSPVVVDKLEMKVPKPEIVVFEIDFDRLISLIPASMEYSPIPKFPCIERDIAIIVDDKLSAPDIENLIRAYPSELIEDVSIFDFYKGRNIPDEKKSLAFTVRYRSDSRTLTEAEVEEMHFNIVKYIHSRDRRGVERFEGLLRPIIGITADIEGNHLKLNRDYAEAVDKAGACSCIAGAFP